MAVACGELCSGEVAKLDWVDERNSLRSRISFLILASLSFAVTKVPSLKSASSTRRIGCVTSASNLCSVAIAMRSTHAPCHLYFGVWAVRVDRTWVVTSVTYSSTLTSSRATRLSHRVAELPRKFIVSFAFFALALSFGSIVRPSAMTLPIRDSD